MYNHNRNNEEEEGDYPNPINKQRMPVVVPDEDSKFSKIEEEEGDYAIMKPSRINKRRLHVVDEGNSKFSKIMPENDYANIARYGGVYLGEDPFEKLANTNSQKETFIEAVSKMKDGIINCVNGLLTQLNQQPAEHDGEYVRNIATGYRSQISKAEKRINKLQDDIETNLQFLQMPIISWLHEIWMMVEAMKMVEVDYDKYTTSELLNATINIYKVYPLWIPRLYKAREQYWQGKLHRYIKLKRIRNPDPRNVAFYDYFLRVAMPKRIESAEKVIYRNDYDECSLSELKTATEIMMQLDPNWRPNKTTEREGRWSGEVHANLDLSKIRNLDMKCVPYYLYQMKK